DGAGLDPREREERLRAPRGSLVSAIKHLAIPGRRSVFALVPVTDAALVLVDRTVRVAPHIAIRNMRVVVAVHGGRRIDAHRVLRRAVVDERIRVAAEKHEALYDVVHRLAVGAEVV